jgi:NAD(P)-dependent dehydrogenase (short-subunit alcohol dehydrogenase family)
MGFSLDQFLLDGKVAIVTGAGGRGNSIGRAYALGLASAGAKVVVADLNGEGAQRVADEIKTLGNEAIAVQVDITSRDSVSAMAEAAAEAFGGIDILVNNAALMVEVVATRAIDYDPEQWQRILDVNLTGAFNCCQVVVPYMRQRGGGKIVNQVSAGAFPAQSTYGITKLAMVGLTTTLATELGPESINVNAIAPGATQSDAGKSLTQEDSPYRQMLNMIVPMRVEGQPDELVGALLLLCSPAGSWMTGQVLNVDGGWIMRS